MQNTVQSQYAASPRIKALIEAFAAKINIDDGVDTFYKNIFDIETASGVGLDIWGSIVDIGRVIWLEESDLFFGFDNSQLQPFGQGTFYKPSYTENYTLDDDEYRRLILMKSETNIAPTSLASLNNIIRKLFAYRGECWVEEVGAMRLRYVFAFKLTRAETALLQRHDLPIKPAGVQFEIYQTATGTAGIFGFEGSGFVPFGFGRFN